MNIDPFAEKGAAPGAENRPANGAVPKGALTPAEGRDDLSPAASLGEAGPPSQDAGPGLRRYSHSGFDQVCEISSSKFYSTRTHPRGVD